MDNESGPRQVDVSYNSISQILAKLQDQKLFLQSIRNHQIQNEEQKLWTYFSTQRSEEEQKIERIIEKKLQEISKIQSQITQMKIQLNHLRSQRQQQIKAKIEQIKQIHLRIFEQRIQQEENEAQCKIKEQFVKRKSVQKKQQFGFKDFKIGAKPKYHQVKSYNDQSNKFQLSLNIRKVNFFQQPLTQEQILTLTGQSFQIQKIATYPYCAIGAVIMDSQYIGTGTIIGPQIILTCAQNCLNIEQRIPKKSISFTPASQFIWPFEKYKAKKIYYHSILKIDKNEIKKNDYFYQYDIAVIQLDTTDNLEELYGSISYDFNWISEKEKIISKNNNALIIGFQVSNKQPVLTQFRGNFIADEKFIWHRMSTEKINNGSPVLEQINGEYFLRGLQSANIENERFFYKTAVAVNTTTFIHLQEQRNPEVLIFDLASQLNLEGLQQLINYMKTEIKSQSTILLNIDLRKNGIKEEGCKYLKEAGWSALQGIYLGYNDLTDKGCQHLKNASWLYLQEIGLNQNKITKNGCKLLIQANWPCLKNVYLSYNQIADQGCQILKNSKWPCLQTLHLRQNKITNVGCCSLKQGRWPNLKALDLSSNDITDQGIGYLNHLHNLSQLDLYGNKITGQNLHLKQTDFPNLQKLQLDKNKINDKGCLNLSKLEFRSLKLLHLANNAITDEGCIHLSQAKWPRLKTLNLKGKKITNQGRQCFFNSTWQIFWS